MKERPILFSAPMIRALLSGAKTQTRRTVHPMHMSITGELLRHPYGGPGDRLWVRETCIIAHKDFPDFKDQNWPRDNEGVPRVVQYLASHPDREHAADYGYTKATPSIHMPRWASRITLEVTDVRVERLQDISEYDARAEGIAVPRCDCEVCMRSSAMCPADASEHIMAFAQLWETINGKRAPWASNPWVWAISFRKVD